MTTTTASLATTIAASARRGLSLVEGLAADIPADRFARFAEAGGTTIRANHPAFCYGHLAIYPAWIMDMLGGDSKRAGVPEAWQELFKNGAECRDDPEGSIYPGKDELVKATSSGYAAVLEHLEGVDEAILGNVNPVERMRATIPTAGMMVCFMLNSHVMFHLGQVSTWRRCIGLGSVM